MSEWLLLHFPIPVARIRFENVAVLVEEGARFAELPVVVIGATTLGGEVTVRFSTSYVSATGHLCHAYHIDHTHKHIAVSFPSIMIIICSNLSL